MVVQTGVAQRPLDGGGVGIGRKILIRNNPYRDGAISIHVMFFTRDLSGAVRA